MTATDLILPPDPAIMADPEAAWPVTRTVRLGTVITLAVAGFFLVWGTFVPLSSAVVATGELVGAANRQLIQHLEGGVVREIRVREGDHVRAGDVIVRLDDQSLRADLAAVELILAETIFRLARLEAESAGRTVLSLDTPAPFTEADPARINAVRAGQQQLFTARRATAERLASEQAARIEAARTNAAAFSAQAEAKRTQSALIRAELTRREGLRERSLGTQDTLFAAELQLAQTDAEVGQLEANAIQAEATARQGEAERDRMRAERQQDIRAEMAEARTRRSELEAQRAKLSTALSRTEIRAPATGIVAGFVVHTVGGVITPSQQLGLVVPQDSALVVAAAVPPQDIDRVRTGQPARIRFAAFNQRTTPELNGTVRTVAADRTTTPDGRSFYLAEITLDDPPPKGLSLLPGMQADVLIQNGERTLVSYLFKPITDGFAKALTER